MTNTELLLKIINEKGVKKSKLVEALNTSYNWLNKKIYNEIPFKAWEISKLCEVLAITDLRLKDSIFFYTDVDKMSTKKEY